jgi:hypothetical protein
MNANEASQKLGKSFEIVVLHGVHECNGEARPGVSLSPGRHEAADRCALSLGFSTMPSCAFRKMRLGHCEPHHLVDPDFAVPVPDLRDRARGLSWFEKSGR